LGATRALETLIVEEEERVARQHAHDSVRFTGTCFSLSRGDNAFEPPVRGPPEVMEAPQQNYPGLSKDEIVVPFLIFGRGNLKTGQVVMEKIHINLVHNSITYRGRMRAMHIDSASCAERPVECSGIMHQFDNAGKSVQESLQHTTVHVMRFALNARWSSANLAVIARVQPQVEATSRSTSMCVPSVAATAQDNMSLSADRLLNPSARHIVESSRSPHYSVAQNSPVSAHHRFPKPSSPHQQIPDTTTPTQQINTQA